MKIDADGRYQLFLNGIQAAEGPCQSSSFVRYYDEIDGSRFLTAGKNTISVRLLYASENEMITVYRGSRPSLRVEAELTERGKTVSFGTDKSWKCVRDDSIRFFRDPKYQNTIPEFEERRAVRTLTPVGITEKEGFGLKTGGWDDWGVCVDVPLAPRPIPQMETKPPISLRTVKSGPGFLVLDAGRYVTAKVTFRLKGEAGRTVRIVYGECFLTPDGEGRLFKGMRDNVETGVLTGPCDLVDTNGEEQIVSPFWYRAFRFIRLAFTGELTLSEAVFCENRYPLTEVGSFTGSEGSFNQIWDVSVNTLRCCMHETYFDCPHYEQLQYGMDSALEALFTYRLTDDRRLPKKSLTDLAHSQRPDGMLQASYPSQLVQVIPSFSLFWIFMLKDYLLYAGDRDFVRSMTGTADKILEGFRSFLDERGLVGVTPYWHFVDWVPGWERGVPPGGEKEPLTVYSMMYAAALKAAADIAGSCGRAALAEEYRARSEKMNERVRRFCYDEKKGLFRDTPSGEGFSEHTSAWAVLSGVVTGQEAVWLMKRTLGENVAKCSFAMCFYLFRALEETGLYRLAFDRFDGWRDMLKKHCTTWCENPDEPRSECHGWSSVPLYELSAVILGVKPGGIGFESVIIKPFTDVLDHAGGTVPTPRGPVAVSWKKEAGRLILDAALPDGLSTVVSLGGLKRYETRGPRIHLVCDLKRSVETI